MIQIRPVSDLRNKFSEIEKVVCEGEPVYLTKNGYGSMVVMSLEAYSRLTDGVENILKNYNVSRELLEEYNDLNDLKIGDKIIIPVDE